MAKQSNTNVPTWACVVASSIREIPRTESPWQPVVLVHPVSLPTGTLVNLMGSSSTWIGGGGLAEGAADAGTLDGASVGPGLTHTRRAAWPDEAGDKHESGHGASAGVG